MYNVSAVSLSPRMMEQELRKYLPSFEIVYKRGDSRQLIADSWPRSLDDSAARKDWGWKPRFGLEAMTRQMLLETQRALRSAGHTTVPLKGLD